MQPTTGQSRRLLTHICAVMLAGVLPATAAITLKLDTKDHEGNEVGRVIVLNGDDDNNNGVPDLDENPVIGETNLRKLTISWDMNGVALFLKSGANGDKVRFWKDPEKNTEVKLDGKDNMYFASPQVVYVEGIKPSDKTDDVELFVNFTNKDDQKATVKLTVLWIDQWEFRVKGTEAWHADFRPANNPRTHEVDPKDGMTGLHVYTDRLGQGIELRGRVKPSDFAPRMSQIHRAKQICRSADLVDGHTYVGSQPNFSTNNHLARLRPAGAEADDCDTCNQLDPQANGAGGYVYDWDDSGITNTAARNTISRQRKNFVQWPRFGSERAGVLAFWSQWISAKAAVDPPQNTLAKIPLEHSFDGKNPAKLDRGDNADLGSGLDTGALKTNLSWNLASASCGGVGLRISTTSLPNGQVATKYDQTLQSAGGFPPIKWTVSGGALPDGLALDANTGRITGTPTKAGTFNFKIKATDSQSGAAANSVERSLRIVVAAAAPAPRAPQTRTPTEVTEQTVEDPVLSGRVVSLLAGLRSDDRAVARQSLDALREAAGSRQEAPWAFDRAEEAVVESLNLAIATPDAESQRFALGAIQLLGELGGEKSIGALADHFDFRDPDVVLYHRGPETYTDPLPGDLPAFEALAKLNGPAVRRVLAMAMERDDPFAQQFCADLMVTVLEFKGALIRLDEAAAGPGLDEIHKARLAAIRGFVESYR